MENMLIAKCIALQGRPSITTTQRKVVSIERTILNRSTRLDCCFSQFQCGYEFVCLETHYSRNMDYTAFTAFALAHCQHQEEKQNQQKTSQVYIC